MKLVGYLKDGAALTGVADNGVVRQTPSLFDGRPGDEVGPLNELKLTAPIPEPGKIICVGLNYRDHAEETGMPIPASPILFSKFNNTVIGPGDPIKIPSITKECDYEAELGVVIGRTASGVKREKALDYVLGYTCVNDVSARDLQFADGQWVRGKTLDTFCPMGPWIVTADEIEDPQTLGIRCDVNGTRLQDSSTAQMIFPVDEIISFISEAITLEAGDLIATGTPVGVGFARKPPVYLKPGDTVVVEIDGIGVLENPVEAR